MLNGKSDSKYPLEFIGEGEHEMPYSKMKKPTLYSNVGIWEINLIQIRFGLNLFLDLRYYFNDKKTNE